MKKRWFYSFAFFIPFLSVLGICIANGVYPFGKNSFMHCDMYHQYVPFLVEFWRKLHGGESLFYSWNVGIGSDFTTIFAYYLATPTNWLVYFCPEHLIIEFMTLMILIKTALCGPAFAYYLRQRFQTDSPLIWGFSTLYAMSGFVAAYNWNPMWLDVLWLTPLVILGLEKLVHEQKCRLYCLALAASVFTNYYLSIMLCMFLVLYFIVLLFTGGLKWREKGKAVGNFALYSLLAGGMAGVLLLPVMTVMRSTGFDDAAFPKKLTFYFNGLEVLARHFLTIPVEIGLDHWPNIFCGTVMFLLLPMYLLCGKIPLKQRIGKGLLAVFMLLSFSVNILNFIWHGMNYPDSLPGRQAYLYIFLLLTMGFETVMHIKEWRLPWFIAAVLAGGGVMALCSIFVKSEGFTVSVAALTWCFFSVYVILAACFLLLPGKRKFLLWAAVAVLVGECIINMEETSISVVQRAYYANKWENYEELYKTAEDKEDFYRFESFCDMTKNDSALAGYPGVSVFSSTTGSHMADLYDALGMEGTKVSYYTDGATAFTEALLGVRYTFSERKEDEQLYRQAGQRGKMYLYENRYSLPVGYAVSEELRESMEKIILNGSSNRLEMQNKLGELLGAQGSMFAYLNRGDLFEVGESGQYYGFVSANSGKSIVMNEVMDLTQPASEQTAAAREYKDVKKNSILDLGYLEAGSEWLFTSDEKEDAQKPQIWFYKLNTEALEAAVERLRQQPFEVQEYRDGYLRGTAEVGEAGDLLLSVPSEEGWKIFVDGMEREPESWAQAMIRIPLEKGAHTVEMRYCPLGLGLGACISAVSLAVFLGMEVWVPKRCRRKKIQADKTAESEVCNG